MEKERISFILSSDKLNDAIAVLTIATSASALEKEVFILFAFGGINCLRSASQKHPRRRNDDEFGRRFGDNISRKIFGFLEKGGKGIKFSDLKTLGLGKYLVSKTAKKELTSFSQLLEMAKGLDTKLMVCNMSMTAMGVKREELVFPDLEYVDMVTFLQEAWKSKFFFLV